MSPNRVNKAHWPTKENRQMFYIFLICSVHGEKVWDGPKWARKVFCPANPDLANILGDMDLDFVNFRF